jgi:carbonic anhydrase
MGHEGCGAVDAAISYKFEGQKQAEKIETLLETILPSLDGINPLMNKKALLASAVEANVRHTVKTLSETPEGISQIAQGAMLIGAVYDIHTGKVRFLE